MKGLDEHVSLSSFTNGETEAQAQCLTAHVAEACQPLAFKALICYLFVYFCEAWFLFLSCSQCFGALFISVKICTTRAGDLAQ